MRKSKQGITLLELTLALGILAIVSVGITLGITSIQRRAIANAALQLQSDIHYAQRRAIAEGVQYQIFFEVARNRYHIRVMSIGQWGIVRTVYLPQGVSVSINNGPSTISFLPRGTPSSRPGTIRLLGGRYQQNLTVNPSGGRVEIQDMTRSSR